MNRLSVNSKRSSRSVPNYMSRVISSSDVNFVAQMTPLLIQTVTILLKRCLEKSEMFVLGPHLTVEKRNALLATNRNLHNQVKEFIKSPKLFNMLCRSTETKSFCHQLLSQRESYWPNGCRRDFALPKMDCQNVNRWWQRWSIANAFVSIVVRQVRRRWK